MSDFDKEAEREKLRKKYERDQQDREATQRMSDLLLKGATMTNTHCDVCGDPLFRQQGTTFCPSCHGGPEGVEASVGDQQREASDQQSTETAVSDASERSNDGGTGAADTTAPADSTIGGSDGRTDVTAPESGRVERASPEHQATSSPTASPSPAAGERSPQYPTPHGTSASPPVDGDLETATDALVAALERFAAAAAEADDPRYAKECLEAAHEAAETLGTLRQ
ncbi:Sjogren's syndrome/scleroderma autoantigen 1 family protein [Natronosalvus vescus]|uniref:Sjogren's syndrome/scleroderma autoantigen 1 family protein n=1 Tax=Natronosalvus vescus TaxID=2953881 RepID=UPI0020910129|nr:Sjogren's syndrome/scleroderma autoantigen 1 family protein [Natronosalvus vescus]